MSENARMSCPPDQDTETARPRIDRYDPTEIEARWQQRWEELGLHDTDLEDETRQRYYLLTMYPYPSGDLHIGHWYIVTPTDARARFLRMNGYNVFLPIGFDAFGLPAENAAIKSGVHPATWTLRNIENMRRQFRSMGATLDWSAEVVTCLPEYYRWNQWLFLQFIKAGLAYRQMAPVDWCPRDQVVLAREQVEGADRVCWRCGTPVIKRDLEQWFFRITKYADELLDFTGIDWPEPIRLMQTNWIGRSEGADVIFRTAPSDHHAGGAELRVFTTRPDTLFGATFMVLAPEHPLVAELTSPGQRETVEAYVAAARRQSEIERLSTDREKTGVPIGADAVNPVNGERIPIWIADYVLACYGTGAIMAVPAHDERDFAFAQRFGLPIVRVVAGRRTTTTRPCRRPTRPRTRPTDWWPADPTAGCPGRTASPPSCATWKPAARPAPPSPTASATGWSAASVPGARPSPSSTATADCGIVPLPEDQLPVVLPDDFAVPPGGGNPLLSTESFLRTTCPTCGGPARRETDTMDTFVDSLLVLVALPRRRTPDRARHRPRARGALVPRGPVHGWRRARRHAPALQPLLRQGARGPGRRQGARALQATLQPGPDPGRRRRAHEQEPRQRPGPRRAGAPLRRRHRAPLPDVHGPLGPGRSVEPAGHRGHPPLPAARLDRGPGPDRAGAR